MDAKIGIKKAVGRKLFMETGFGRIFDFDFTSAKKMYNSSYLEDLTELLSSVSTHLDDDSNYFFGEKYYLKNFKNEPNNDFKDFVDDFKNSFYYGTSEKINIIRGRAGIGKTLFLKRGIRKLIRENKSCNDKYIWVGVDFKNIDNDEKIMFYEEWIYKKICESAIDGILSLDLQNYKEFKEKCKEIEIPYKTDIYYLFPLKFLCEKITQKYNVPCVIVFDNIDLASTKTQTNVFKALARVCDAFSRFMEQSEYKSCYRIYFSMRPDAELVYTEANLGTVINFPLPNVLKIFFAVMKKTLEVVAMDFDGKRELACYVTCQNLVSKEDDMISLKSFTDVANYFYNILDYFLGDIWSKNPNICERLGTSEEFHCNIVNYNVRTFLNFMADTIGNGGFKPLTKEFNRQSKKHYSTYDYIEMIIRGRWKVHPGNAHINSEGGNMAPIVYNIFDTSLYVGEENKVKHFMLKIRILQYCFLCGDNFKIIYENMKCVLSNFFGEEQISDATKKLIKVRFLYSDEYGDNEIKSIHWKNIQIKDNSQLEITPLGRFYLEKMICEFEYLYQMALSSLMCEEFIVELGDSWRTEKEYTVLYFLKSIFVIIKSNIQNYNDEQINNFKRLFYYNENIRGTRPFRLMLDRFISVMESKVQSAERWETYNIEKLNGILDEARKLKTEVERYIIEALE